MDRSLYTTECVGQVNTIRRSAVSRPPPTLRLKEHLLEPRRPGEGTQERVLLPGMPGG